MKFTKFETLLMSPINKGIFFKSCEILKEVKDHNTEHSHMSKWQDECWVERDLFKNLAVFMANRAYIYLRRLKLIYLSLGLYSSLHLSLPLLCPSPLGTQHPLLAATKQLFLSKDIHGLLEGDFR